jgi:hypothetical protein
MINAEIIQRIKWKAIDILLTAFEHPISMTEGKIPHTPWQRIGGTCVD